MAAMPRDIDVTFDFRTFRWHPKITSLISGDELDDFNAIGYTIGGMMLFPGNRIDGQWTINQARGCTKQIADRFDLTLECIRRHYKGGASPLSDVLGRYSSFFELFQDFTGYVEFFLLQDLVSADGTVLVAPPFDDFRGSPIPTTIDEYRVYKKASIAFIEARNQRIAASCNKKRTRTNPVGPRREGRCPRISSTRSRRSIACGAST